MAAKTASHIAKPLRSLAVPIKSLTLDPANARTHDAKNIQAITDSLTRFGQRLPVVVQKQGMIVRAGNGRVMAAREMGWETIAAVVVDESSVDATAFALADNRTAELAEWDDEALRLVLSSLEDEGVDPVGWDDTELAELLKDPQGEIVEDEVPEPPEEPTAKRGQLWALGRHRVLCGDSTSAEDVATLLDGASADTVTDPPYGIGYDYESHDDTSNEDNEGLVVAVFKNAPGARIWSPGLMNLGREMMREKGAKVLVWHKGFAQAGNGMGGASTWEPVLVVGVKGGRLPNDYLHFGTDRVPGLRDGHPCPKPVALYAHLIEHLTGRAIYDPFLGSGTTLIAAEQLGRTCYGIEIEPRYVDVIIQRWENLTGEKAELVSDGS